MTISNEAVTALAQTQDIRPHVTPLPTGRNRPNNTHITNLRLEIAQYAKSFYSALGGGAHGHITIICRPGTNDYDELTNNADPFIQPIHPGLPPQFVQGNTNVQINNIRGTYTTNLTNFKAYTEAYEAIQKKLIEVAHKWVEALKHRTTGFTQVAPHQIMAHLYNHCGNLSQSEIDAIETKLTEPWNPDTEQIEDLIIRLTHCQQVAQFADPISNLRLVRAGITVIKQTGKFETPLTMWNGRTAAQQTWPEFQTYWTTQFLAYLDTKENQPITTQDAGYAATDICPPVGFVPPKKFIYFCFTHGLGDDPTHTSATCKFPSEGHQRAATLDDIMGGNPRIRTGKPTIYKPPQRTQRNRCNTNRDQEEKKDDE